MAFNENDDASYAPMRPLPPSYFAETVARWAADGRDSSGVLLAHPETCICNGCVPDAVWAECKKACTQTPFGRLFGDAYQAEAERFSSGDWWGIFGAELMASEEADCAEYRANKARIDAAAAERIAAADRKLKAERVAIREGATRTRHGPVEIRRIAQPCKFLYNCQKADGASAARPTTMHVSTECWSHETGVCPWAHPAMPARAAMRLTNGTIVPASPAIPADPLWDSHWMTDRLYRPAVAGENRFAACAARPPRR